MTPLQAKAQIRTADVTSAVDQALAFVPLGIKLIGFVLLVMLLIRAAKGYKTLSVTEMALIVIAFAAVGR